MSTTDLLTILSDIPVCRISVDAKLQALPLPAFCTLRAAAVITVTALLNIMSMVAAVPMTPFFLGLSPLLIYYLTSGLLSKHVKLYHPAFLSLLSKFSLLLSKFSLSSHY